jgi:hypothetical protein
MMHEIYIDRAEVGVMVAMVLCYERRGEEERRGGEERRRGEE